MCRVIQIQIKRQITGEEGSEIHVRSTMGSQIFVKNTGYPRLTCIIIHQIQEDIVAIFSKEFLCFV